MRFAKVLIVLPQRAIFALFLLEVMCVSSLSSTEATIEVDVSRVTGKVSPFLFGHFIEHEHNAIQGGLWAEILRDRKFEQGDFNRDGVSNGWVPEERIRNRYWELKDGRTPNIRYFIDRIEYYGGGVSQAIKLDGDSLGRASIYQVDLEVVRGRRYVFYVYLRRQGTGKAFVEFGKLGGAVYGAKEFTHLSEYWSKYTAEFTAPEDTKVARIRIGVEGSGTFWIDSASFMPADNLRGMRRDVVAALRSLRIPIMRYPGGCFADEYHWRNGIGPRDQRPETWSDIWKEWDPNDFGIDEFMDLAQELGFQPHITVNYVSGTPEEAAQWVEYANGSAETPIGQLRARNGHPDPYKIKFWAIGNEAAYLCAGHYFTSVSVNEYATRFGQYRRAMHRVDPSVRVMAGGAPPGPQSWNKDLLNLIPVDLLTFSLYTGEGRTPLDTRIKDTDYFYRKVVAEPLEFEERLIQILREMGDRRPRDRPFIAITEYNSWWLTERGDPDYRLCNALYFAGVFHTLLRSTDEVFLAEVCSTINVQGIVGVNGTGVKLTPPYFAFLLYRNHIGGRVLKTDTRAPPVPFNPRLAALDAVATLSDEGNILYLAVINRSESEDVSAQIVLKDWDLREGSPVRVFELNGDDKAAANPYNSTENVNIRKKTLQMTELPFVYRFPAHSVTVLELFR